MMRLKILLGIALFAVLLIAGPVLAQTETTTSDTPAVVATDTVKNAVDAIGPWGTFWQGVKEQVTLWTTIDPVAKAEKLNEFAEKRMVMAQALAEKAENNPKLQERAQKMVEKAEKFMQQITDRKDKIAEKQTERAQKVLQKAAEQSLHRQEIINKIEEKLSPENLQKLEAIRLRGLENSQKIIEVIGSENVSEETKAHLEEVKAKIETHLLEVKTFVEEKKVLLEKAQQGDETAIEELKAIHQERVQTREERKEEVKTMMEEKREVRKEVIQEVKENRQELIEKAKIGDVQAKEQLKEQVKEIKEIRNDKPIKPAICTQEAKVCPDGSSVGRIGPNCEFAPCPTQAIQ